MSYVKNWDESADGEQAAKGSPKAILASSLPLMIVLIQYSIIFCHSFIVIPGFWPIFGISIQKKHVCFECLTHIFNKLELGFTKVDIDFEGTSE